MNILDILGFTAAIGTTGSFIPQAYKVFKTKKTDDLSLGMFLFLCIGILLWIIYGFFIKSFPVIVSNIITFIMTLYILIIKIKQIVKKNKYKNH